MKFFREMSLENLEGFRFLLIILLIVDLIGVVWYLELKKFGIAIMIVILIFMGIILFYERRKYDKMPKKKKDKSTDEEKEDKEEELDFGLPDPDEYTKRLDKAIGFNY